MFDDFKLQLVLHGFRGSVHQFLLTWIKCFLCSLKTFHGQRSHNISLFGQENSTNKSWIKTNYWSKFSSLYTITKKTNLYFQMRKLKPSTPFAQINWVPLINARPCKVYICAIMNDSLRLWKKPQYMSKFYSSNLFWFHPLVSLT